MKTINSTSQFNHNLKPGRLGVLVALAFVTFLAPVMTPAQVLPPIPPIRQRGFFLQALPSKAEVVNGGPAAHYRLSISSQGHPSRVALSCGSTLPNISCSVSPAVVDIEGMVAASARVTASAANDAEPGSYPLFITATGDGAGSSESVTVVLQVEPRP
jgi:hypothetical protein